jgi:hypothetical protein
VAVWAAKGVLFLEPLKPQTPEEDQAITFPFKSVTEIKGNHKFFDKVIKKIYLLTNCNIVYIK